MDAVRQGSTYTRAHESKAAAIMKKTLTGATPSTLLASLRLVVHTAAPVSVEVKERVIGWLGPILTEFYAGSEGNGFCLIDSPTWLNHKGSVGKPLVGEVHICSDDGDELPAGEVGTVWFSGTKRFSYHNDPAKTRRRGGVFRRGKVTPFLG